MNISQIGIQENLPAKIYQSGWVDEKDKFLSTIPQPYGIISMAVDPKYDALGITDLLPNCRFLYRQWIDDAPCGSLSDEDLKCLANFLSEKLKSGINLAIHCVAGASRSSYVTAAVLAATLKISGKEALAIVRRDRGDSYLNTMQPCFIEQIERVFA